VRCASHHAKPGIKATFTPTLLRVPPPPPIVFFHLNVDIVSPDQFQTLSRYENEVKNSEHALMAPS